MANLALCPIRGRAPRSHMCYACYWATSSMVGTQTEHYENEENPNPPVRTPQASYMPERNCNLTWIISGCAAVVAVQAWARVESRVEYTRTGHGPPLIAIESFTTPGNTRGYRSRHIQYVRTLAPRRSGIEIGRADLVLTRTTSNAWHWP